MSEETSEVEIAVKRKTVRFTIDFDAEQHRFLKMYSMESGVQAALVVRALVYLLEISEPVANAVIDEIFGAEEDSDDAPEVISKDGGNGVGKHQESAPETDVLPTKRKTVRFTIDFDSEQHRFLKLFSLESGVQAALVVRALVYLLEVSSDMANAVIDEIFGEG